MDDSKRSERPRTTSAANRGKVWPYVATILFAVAMAVSLLAMALSAG